MDLFTYLMAKKGHNTGRDLFSYLLGKNAGGSGTYTTFSGTSLNISNTVFGKIKNFMLNSTELTQDGTPTPDNPVDVNVIKGENNVVVENKNLAPSNWGENFVSRINDSSLASITTQDNRNCVTYTASAGYGDYDNKYLFKTNWKENTQYTISYFAYSSTGYLNLSIEYTDGTSTSMDGTPITNWSKITLTSTANKTIKYIRGRYTGGITYIDLDTFQVEEGIIATEYVEHQEQNYPISLASKNLLNIANYNGSINNLDIISANQQITIDGIANSGTYTWIVITKDNFFARNGTPSASTIVNYANGKIISTGIVSRIKEVISGTSTIDFNINLYDENGAVVSTPIETTKIIAVGIYLGNGQTFDNYKFGIQLEEGDTTTYEPYYNIEYCKIGDYADQIFKNTTNSPYYDNTLIENEWYLKKNIGKVTFDGSESNWNLSTSYDAYSFWKPNSSFSFLNSRYKKYCNLFQYSSLAFDTAPNPSLCENTGTFSMILFKTNGDYGETVTEWKEWLSSHNVQVYCPLATPTYIHILQEDYPTLKGQLENIYNNSKSYNGQTNITQTNDDLPFNLSVEILEKINI